MREEDKQYGQVAIVLVNWNGWRDTIACIDSCLAVEHVCYRIIVCDNDSQDGSVGHILAWARGEAGWSRDPASPVELPTPRLPRGIALLDRDAAERGDDGDSAELVVVNTGGNLGFAGGNNVGMRWATARGFDYVWLLNNDTVVRGDALISLVRAVQSKQNVGLCGSLLVHYRKPRTVQAYCGAMDRRSFRSRHIGAEWGIEDIGAIEAGDPLKPSETFYPVGASMLATASYLRDVGLMEERYFLYYEEIDWVLRGSPKYAIAIAADSFVYHKEGSSAGSTPDGVSARSMGFLFRARLLAVKRFAPASLPRVTFGILSEAAMALARGRSGKLVAAFCALTGRVKVPNGAGKSA